jgi:hypothetical protein
MTEPTTRPRRTRSARPVPEPRRAPAPTTARDIEIAILRFLRRYPNRDVDLGPLAEELKLDPYVMQLAVERLHRRRMLIAPFIEPGTAGGAELTEKGLRWLIQQEGGKPSETPVLLQRATDRVRAEDEAARLPRSQVYGVRRS